MPIWMRSKIRCGARIALLAGVAALVAGCGGDSDQGAQATAAPTVAVAQGTLSAAQPVVEYRGASAGDWSAVADTVTVTQGASVRTDATGQALLTLYSGVEVEILPGSELAIEALVPQEAGPPQITLRQLGGETLHRVGDIADVENGYVVHTPVASMAVRGTVFGVEVAEDGATRVTVQEGTVQATVGAETYTITPGQQLTVTAQGVTVGPAPLRLPEPTPNPTPSVAAVQAPGERK